MASSYQIANVGGRLGHPKNIYWPMVRQQALNTLKFIGWEVFVGQATAKNVTWCTFLGPWQIDSYIQKKKRRQTWDIGYTSRSGFGRLSI